MYTISYGSKNPVAVNVYTLSRLLNTFQSILNNAENEYRMCK